MKSKLKVLKNNFSDLHGRLVTGLECLENKQYIEAQSIFLDILKTQPSNAELLHLTGITCFEIKDFETAIQYYQRSIKLNSKNGRVMYHLGLALYELNFLEEALAQYDKAIALNFIEWNVFNNRSAILFELHRLNDSLVDVNRAITLNPNQTETYTNKGNILFAQHKLDDALINFEKSVLLNPNDPNAHWGYAQALLQAGEYQKGFSEYEWRYKNPRLAGLFPEQFHTPQWSGEDLKNKTLLIVSEQGLGDSLQFIRYIKKIKELGAEIILSVDEPLIELFRQSTDVFKVIVKGGKDIPQHDFYCRLLSLPFIFNTTLETIPNEVPYLKCNENKKQAWHQKLGLKNKPRIGLVWSGGFRPNDPKLKLVNQRRNIPLEKFSKLKDLDIEIYSLQKGDNAVSELKNLILSNWDGPKLIDYTSELNNFSDTAALIENLDLVIAVDTSTAHLAAALNKPVWILNRHDNCWRWMLERSDSPWYPSATIFRQNSPENWDSVIQDVKKALINKFELEPELLCP
jgi:Flp pilus assembly protein TadD